MTHLDISKVGRGCGGRYVDSRQGGRGLRSRGTVYVLVRGPRLPVWGLMGDKGVIKVSFRTSVGKGPLLCFW